MDVAGGVEMVDVAGGVEILMLAVAVVRQEQALEMSCGVMLELLFVLCAGGAGLGSGLTFGLHPRA